MYIAEHHMLVRLIQTKAVLRPTPSLEQKRKLNQNACSVQLAFNACVVYCKEMSGGELICIARSCDGLGSAIHSSSLVGRGTFKCDPSSCMHRQPSCMRNARLHEF